MKTVNTVEETCCKCGTVFAMDEELQALRKRDGDSFYCPNGHGQHYTQTDATTISDLRAKLKEAEQERDEAKIEMRQMLCEKLRLRQQPKTIWQILRLRA
jgi:hypothetical protein